MKKILITGTNSYIGTSLEKWLLKSERDYNVQTLDMTNYSWRNYDFSSFDSIFHVAAIVHKNERKVEEYMYYKVNRDLTVEVAKKAKREGVKQFIFLSSMSVYGMDEGIITINTSEAPQTHYGKSKLEAEKELAKLTSHNFKVAVLRPPMVYGPNSRGNYTKLSKLSKLIPVFPRWRNQRSMIYLDNLLEFVRKIIDNNLGGLHFPQNKEYVNVSVLVEHIRHIHGKKTFLVYVFNPIIRRGKSIKIIQKIFGNLVYSQQMSQENFEYNIVPFFESIEKSEKHVVESPSRLRHQLKLRHRTHRCRNDIYRGE